MSSRFTLTSLLCASVVFAPAAQLLAEPPAASKPQQGEMVLEDTTQRALSASQRGKAEVTGWLTSLDQVFKGGSVRVPTDLGDAGINYLASFYFFCAVRGGGCPFILDTILESDVVRSKEEKSVSCPTMSRFWKAWLAADYDERAKYSLSPAVAEKFDDFNATQRPRYVRCKETVALVLADRSALEARYAPDGEARLSLDRTRKLLEEIWQKGIDISPQSATTSR